MDIKKYSNFNFQNCHWINFAKIKFTIQFIQRSGWIWQWAIFPFTLKGAITFNGLVNNHGNFWIIPSSPIDPLLSKFLSLHILTIIFYKWVIEVVQIHSNSQISQLLSYSINDGITLNEPIIFIQNWPSNQKISATRFFGHIYILWYSGTQEDQSGVVG